MKVAVQFDCSRPESHVVHVRQVMPATGEASRTFRMAAWIPGSYKLYDLGRHVQDFSASIAGKAARWRQDGKDAWTVRGAANAEIVLEFDVYCRDLTVDTSHVTSDHAHLFPITLVMYDDASRGLPHAVAVTKPRGWSLWSGLETDALDGTLAEAEDYDHLIDCPIEVGPKANYHVETFDLRRRKHRLVFWQPPTGVDWESVRKDVRAICQETCRVWDNIPYSHYTFISHVALGYGGGLEHRNSTVLGVDPLSLLVPEKRKTKFYPLVSHEYFHTWNVKRVKPATFTPYELQEESYTDLLWLFEGFTTYYELPLLARAGVVDEESWSKVAVEMLEYYEMAEGRKRRSVAEASRLSWTLLYQPHEQNINRNVSYYTKGLWVGLCLDAALREAGVAEGLDVVMRHMWLKHGDGTGVPEDGFPALVLEATGVDVKAKMRGWVYGTKELPIAKSLQTLGWKLERDWKEPKAKLALRVHFEEGKPVIARIPDSAPAHGVLQPGDEMVAVEGYKWSGDRFKEIANTRKDGESVELTVFREGRLRSFDVPLTEKPQDKLSIKPAKGAAASKKRKAWLGDLPKSDKAS